MLRYETVTIVYQDNKRIGEIRESAGGFQYFAKGLKKYAGKFFPTLAWCKHSLTEHYDESCDD